MRRRTIQYLVLFFVSAVALHLYFVPPSRAPLFEEDEWSEGAVGGPDVDNETPVRRLEADVPKRDAVVAAFKYAWSAYARDAMGSDEYHPLSHSGNNHSTSGGIGYTIVDAIDTMLLMDLKDEYAQARDWVRDHLSFDRDGRTRCFNTFETTIRVLGGLLSAHHLTSSSSSDASLFLHHAVDLADRLLPVFDTSSGLPLSSVNLATRVGLPNQYNPREISTAEATTLQLEFRYLAQLTGNESYWYKAEKVMQVVEKARLENNLAPISMNVDDGQYMSSEIRLGSRGDSYYEYLLKQYLQTKRTEPVYLKMYEDAMQGIHEHLIRQTPRKKLTYTAELLPRGPDWRTSWTSQDKQDHLVCFLAGSLMLGAATTAAADTSHLRKRAPPPVRPPAAHAHLLAVSRPPRMAELSERGRRDWDTGVRLLEGCMETHKTATGLSPEIVQFTPPTNPASDVERERDWHIKGSKPGGPATYDARYMLRPETVESLFLAYRLTGEERYRAWAWDIFSAIEKHAKLPGGGYATVLDVDTVPARLDDKQETFFLSETLKYLYLIFADEGVLSLEDHVFNTEAHPLPVFRLSIKPRFTL